MAETALSKQMDSDKPERACAWCDGPLPKGHQRNRTLCSNRCKKASFFYRHRELVRERQRAYNKSEAGRAANARYLERLRAETLRRREEKSRSWPRRPNLCGVHFHACNWCGTIFAHNMLHAKFCCSEHKHAAKEQRRRKSGKKAATDKAYRERNLTKTHEREARRWRETGVATRLREFEERDRLANPEKYRAKARAKQRRRAAGQALALLIMPIENQETNQ